MQSNNLDTCYEGYAYHYSLAAR
jgi:MORN repeat